MGKTVLEAKVVDIQKRRYPSKHYVYVIEVIWSEGTQTLIYRRYSNFFEFQCGLLAKFPIQAGQKNPADRCIPFLPGKKIFGRSHVRSVAEKRMGPISDYCQAVIRLPQELSQDPYILNFFEVTPEDINPPVKEEKAKKHDTANEISDPILLDQYTAIADYKKQKDTECSLSAGQVVEVIDKNENGWWFVHMDDLNEGWVPATYLEPIYGQNEASKPIILEFQETHITTSNYIAKNPDELTFERGVLMEVFQKGMDGWWKAKYLDKEGYVPACYLTRYYGAVTSETTGPTQMVTTAQEAVQTTLQRPAESTAKSSHVSAAKPMRAMPVIKPGVDPYANEPIYAPTPRKEMIKKANPKPPPIISLKKPSLTESTKNKDVSDDSDDEDVFHDYETLSEHYMTIADFTAGVDDGLSFSTGQEVSVITKNPSGWWFVELGSNEGWVPSSYLEKSFRPHDHTPTPAQKEKPARAKSPAGTSKPQPKPSTSKPAPKTEESIPKIVYPSTSSHDVPALKPKPPVQTKPATKTDGGTSSVAAMAAALSSGLNSKSVPLEKPARSFTTSLNKPSVPKRVPTKSSENEKPSTTRDSFKRSSSSDSIRDIGKDKQPLSNAKSPPPLRPRPAEFIPPPKSRMTLQSTSSPQLGLKFLRKSTENLVEAQEAKDPVTVPKQTLAATLSNGKPEKPRPPPARTSAGAKPFSTQTIKLGELEHSLSAKKPVAGKRASPAVTKRQSAVTPSAPPKRPQVAPRRSAAQSKKVPPPRPSNSPAQTRKSSYVTIADFIGTDASSLSFKEGSSVDVLEKTEEGWWFVNINGQEGWVPSTFIEKTTNKPDRPKPPQPQKKPKPVSPPAKKISENSYRAISDYATPVYEDSGINLVAGEIYEVIEKTSTGWWFVQHESKEGWAPSSFLEPAD